MSTKHPEVLAIIPARGKSKSIPRKNIKPFAGYPLIAYSIAAALQSHFVRRTIVSTDDAEIATISKEYGAEVPFLRPAELADDQTVDLPVFQHALDWLQIHENYLPDIVVHLRPTSPIRPKNCVDEAISILLAHADADCVRGVVLAGQNPYKMWHIQPNGMMAPILTLDGVQEAYNAPRQVLPTIYWQSGHIDAIRSATIRQKGSMTGDHIYPLIIDPTFAVDIDTMLDWSLGERLVWEGGLEMVLPSQERRPFPKKVSLVLLDFDGVMTDDRVWVDENGHEMVAVQRGDGLGISLIRQKMDVEFAVISNEKNPVVLRRCEKLGITCFQGVADKTSVIETILAEKKFDRSEVVYIGNDVNDLACFDHVGFSVAPADAHKQVKMKVDLVLNKYGGVGAIREFCDILLSRNS